MVSYTSFNINVILSITSPVGEHYLPFIDLPIITEISSTSNAISLLINITIPFGRSHYHIVYVS